MCRYAVYNLCKFYTKICMGEEMEFKIKKQEYVNRTYRITKELAEELSKVAQEENISVNELVVQCCKFALKNRKGKA